MTTLNGSTISTVITRALGRKLYQSATQVFVIIANYSNLSVAMETSSRAPGPYSGTIRFGKDVLIHEASKSSRKETSCGFILNNIRQKKRKTFLFMDMKNWGCDLRGSGATSWTKCVPRV